MGTKSMYMEDILDLKVGEALVIKGKEQFLIAIGHKELVSLISQRLDKSKVLDAIEKATLGKVNDYTNADFEGFVDADILKKELVL